MPLKAGKSYRRDLEVMNTENVNFQDDEASRSTSDEDSHNSCSVFRSKVEKEIQRRRREWQREQERNREHEKLKREIIEKFERKRALALEKEKRENSLRYSRSKSSSEPPSHLSIIQRSEIRDRQNAAINISELRQIKVHIVRNIPAGPVVTELQRDILDPADITIKRREGEGCKPIFDRKEIKKGLNKSSEIEERSIVIATDKEHSASTVKPCTLKRQSSSLNPIGDKFYSSRHSTSHSSRSSSTKYREYKEKYTEKDSSRRDTRRSRSRELYSYSRSVSEKFDCKYRERSNERSYEIRDRSRDRDRDRDRNRSRDWDRDRDRNREKEKERERKDIVLHGIGSSLPVPISYNTFPPRPIVASPMVPLRGQIPSMARIHPGLMAPVRPFLPRFLPYRLRHPPLIQNINTYQMP